ncbi:non-hydrolyzing UDP-N-acetylglucosamine 2-epimerase [Aminivibrio sp.]|uniref:non-hydrolyzing UDP-N-acetylglucosamine 2-epimerase n=1 Tax=Aminivibrio sp. TaxID=1872489 RepID=UPI001A5CAA97|nr:UDP-N-acetylglucosamine 2-epimerase (non-hydrolyzing) [Aminivibrio sp.]MBL3538284.1 UDP-N-acetylglucosamine 2-epimerase (non-hydrolyzing) [Aminivibrio sp.]
MKKVVSLVGARPQFIKEAVIGAEVRRRNAWNHILVHSGQHYDANMSDIFFTELDMKQPDYFLGVGSGFHGKQTAEVLIKFEDLLLKEKPDLVLVYGDTNTTVAGALAASKLKIPVAHVEAGIRQSPKDMPEEINRVLTDHISKYLFCCSDLAAKNLEKEGITEGVFVAGDVMYDLYLKMKPRFTPKETREQYGLEEGRYIIATLHRDFNVDNQDSLRSILEGLVRVKKETGLEILLPIHPRTRKRIVEFGLGGLAGSLQATEPIGYLDLMSLTQDCAAVVTDSGGYQKEAYYAGKRAAVVMPDTGWREIVDSGWNILCGPKAEELAAGVASLSQTRHFPGSLFGNGNAGECIVSSLLA